MKYILIVFLFCLSVTTSFSFEKDGICYNINGTTASVARYDKDDAKNSNFYKGDLVIPNTITIGDKTYDVTAIEDRVFANNLYATSLRIGANIREIGKDAFFMSWIGEIELDKDNKDFVLENDILYSADYTRAINLTRSQNKNKNVKLHDEVRIIDRGFANAERLNTLEFGSKVEWIGDSAFFFALSETFNQKELYLPNSITHIGKAAFYHCIRLNKKIHLPESLTRLEEESFSYCGPESINLPKTLKVICDRALMCNSGSSYRNLVLPEGLDSIGTLGVPCINTDTLIIPSTLKHVSKYSITSSSYYVEYRPQWDSIPAYSFYDSSIRKLVLPKTLKRIGDGVFYECYDLKEIVWPDSLEYIGAFAFAGNKVEPMVIPSTVSYIGDQALADNVGESRTYYLQSATPPVCGNVSVFKGVYLEESKLYVPRGSYEAYASQAPWSYFGTIEEYDEIVLPAPILDYDFEANSLFYNITSEENNTCEITSHIDRISLKNVYSGTIDIPSSVEYNSKTYKVTGIDDGTFNYARVSSVTIPESIDTIGARAFANCAKLLALDIPQSVKYIGVGAFHACTGLASIVLPENLNIISASLFNGCSSLESVNIPETVTSISASAFSGCSSLVAIDIPSNVKSIGEKAFYFCSKLKAIVIPYGIEIIEEGTFQNCESLENITLPETLKYIYEGAFEECRAIKDVTSLAVTSPIPVWGDFIFSAWVGGTLHVLPGSKESYASLRMWQDFNIVEDANAVSSIEEIYIQDDHVKTFNLQGIPVDESYKGIKIRNGKKVLYKLGAQ